MGRIIKTGLAVGCDRCGRDVAVNDPGLVAFYENFLATKEPDDAMFAFVTNFPGGVKQSTLEIVCPECIGAIQGYVERADKRPPRAPRGTKSTAGAGDEKDAQGPSGAADPADTAADEAAADAAAAESPAPATPPVEVAAAPVAPKNGNGAKGKAAKPAAPADDVPPPATDDVTDDDLFDATP